MKPSADLKPQFIKKDNVPRHGMIVTVASIERRDMSRNLVEEDFKWILTFKEGWRLQLNQTNLRTVIELLGDSEDGEDWPGKRLGLIVDPEIVFKDNTTGETKHGGIRVVSFTAVRRSQSTQSQKREYEEENACEEESEHEEEDEPLPF
jgi:hypothetical protein